jgi:hypothetical protein
MMSAPYTQKNNRLSKVKPTMAEWGNSTALETGIVTDNNLSHVMCNPVGDDSVTGLSSTIDLFCDKDALLADSSKISMHTV